MFKHTHISNEACPAYAYIYVYIYTVGMYIYIHIYIYIQTNKHTNKQTYTHTYIHTCIHTYITHDISLWGYNIYIYIIIYIYISIIICVFFEFIYQVMVVNQIISHPQVITMFLDGIPAFPSHDRFKASGFPQ